jgi:hypothetical protein
MTFHALSTRIAEFQGAVTAVGAVGWSKEVFIMGPGAGHGGPGKTLKLAILFYF